MIRFFNKFNLILVLTLTLLLFFDLFLYIKMDSNEPIGDKAQYKPAGYKQLQYNPAQKLATEADLKNVEQKKL